MVEYFAERMPASRIIINAPSALGGIGGTTGLMPALTLGCGAIGGSATSENVGPMNLLNKRHVAEGLLELDEIKAGLPTCTDGMCSGPKAEDVDIDAVVNEIVKRLRSM